MEFYNKNSYRAYPFMDDAVMTAVINGTEYQVPMSVFVELRLNLVSAYPAGLVTLKSLRFVGVTMICVFSVAGIDTELVFDVAVPTPGSYWVSRGNDQVSGITWLAVFGSGLEELMSNATDHSVVFVAPPVVTPGLVRDLSQTRVASIADAYGHQVTGDVLLEEGYNCSISVSGHTINISAKARAGAGLPCDETEAIGCGDVLYHVNGVNAEHLKISGAGIKITPHPEEHALDIEAIPEDECQ